MAEQKFVTGALLEYFKGGKAIMEHTYAQAFGGENNDDLSIAWLDDDGNIVGSMAWLNKAAFEVLDSENIQENLEKLRAYNRKIGAAPIAMKPEVAKELGYTSIHTYKSAIAGDKVGEIRLY